MISSVSEILSDMVHLLDMISRFPEILSDIESLLETKSSISEILSDPKPLLDTVSSTPKFLSNTGDTNILVWESNCRIVGKNSTSSFLLQIIKQTSRFARTSSIVVTFYIIYDVVKILQYSYIQMSQ